MLDLFGKTKCHRKRSQTLLLSAFVQVGIRLVEIMIDLIVQFRITHSFHWSTSHMQDIDLEYELCIRWNKANALLRTISKLRRYNQSYLFILSYFFQSKLKTPNKSFSTNEKLSYSISLRAHYLRPIHMKYISKSIQGHPWLGRHSRAIPEAILNDMKRHNNFFYTEQSLFWQPCEISILFIMISHYINIYNLHQMCLSEEGYMDNQTRLFV